MVEVMMMTMIPALIVGMIVEVIALANLHAGPVDITQGDPIGKMTLRMRISPLLYGGRLEGGTARCLVGFVGIGLVIPQVWVDPIRRTILQHGIRVLNQYVVGYHPMYKKQ